MSGLVGTEALKLAQALWNTTIKGKGYERILNQVVITSAGQGSCVAEFKVEEGMINRLGTLHGGCTATLIDCISTLGLMTITLKNPGVSVNLSVSYLKAATLGETLVIDSKTVKSGKTISFLEAELKSKETGKLIAVGNHVKFMGC